MKFQTIYIMKISGMSKFRRTWKVHNTNKYVNTVNECDINQHGIDL